MTNLYLAGVCVFAILLVAVLIWLVREQLRFKSELQALNELTSRSGREITGLCSFTDLANERLVGLETLVHRLQAKVADLKLNEAQRQPYSGIIQKVQAGASLGELMQNFGLSSEEAALLIRLHGQTPDKH